MNKNTLIIFLWLSMQFSSCDNDNNSIKNPYVNYSIDLSVVTSGYNGEWCWFQPRAASCGNDKDIVMLMQPWVTSHPDFILFMHEMTTTDGGRTWAGPISLVDSLGEELKDNIMTRICDVTPLVSTK